MVTAYTGSAPQTALLAQVLYRADELGADVDDSVVDAAQLWADLGHAAAAVLEVAPRVRVTAAAVDAAPISGVLDGLHLGVTLPASCLRVLRVRLSSWMHPVDELTTPDASAYRLARHGGAAGASVHRPLAALVPAAGGAPGALELYPATVGTTVSQLLYVPRLAPEAMPGSLRDAMLWEATSRLLQTLRSAEAKTAAARASAALSSPSPLA